MNHEMNDLVIGAQQEQMNTQYRKIVSGLLLNAERDLRLAKASGDLHAQGKAQARYDTLSATLQIYVAAHYAAYQVRPWPTEPMKPTRSKEPRESTKPQEFHKSPQAQEPTQ